MILMKHSLHGITPIFNRYNQSRKDTMGFCMNNGSKTERPIIACPVGFGNRNIKHIVSVPDPNHIHTYIYIDINHRELEYITINWNV